MDETCQEISFCSRFQHFSWDAYPARCSIEVPVKTVLDFASVFTSSRNDGRLDELLVEREVAVVENDGKTAAFFQ
jgi:hypothetical protein